MVSFIKVHSSSSRRCSWRAAAFVSRDREPGPRRRGIRVAIRLISAFTTAGLPGAIIAPVIVRFSAEFKALHDDGHLRGLACRHRAFSSDFRCRGPADIDRTGPSDRRVLARGAMACPVHRGDDGLWFASGSLRAFVQGMQSYSAFGASCVAEGAFRVLAVGAFIALALALHGAR